MRTALPKARPALACMHGSSCRCRPQGVETRGGAHPNFCCFLPTCPKNDFIPLRTGQPKIDPRGSPPYAGGILRHAQRTLGRAPRRWVVLGRARRAFENGLKSRTPIHCNSRFSKSNVAARSGRLTLTAPPSLPAMHAPEAILTFGAAGRQEARVRAAFFCFGKKRTQSPL